MLLTWGTGQIQILLTNDVTALPALAPIVLDNYLLSRPAPATGKTVPYRVLV